jgi:uncharacterized membrane protein YedE/YeeE|tara:strand:+ start:10960 stop:11388 length:429 start_codon:yes stop_codon:yes gene_type:complete
MTEFTPISSALGGILIGLSAFGGFLLFGRVIGMSGMMAKVLGHDLGKSAWRAFFFLGLIGIPWILSFTISPPHDAQPFNPVALILGGFLVGYGTRLGSGCTSGHAICGISRLSKRSIVATCTFMVSAVVTVFVTRHIFGVMQ